MGSKNNLAVRIIDLFPKADTFYDLFAGGCAVTHAALLSHKFDNVIANDIDGYIPQLFLDACNGKYKDETRWISREDFNALKDTDAYVAVCWSFGNNRRTYLYGKDIESQKRALHYAVVFGDYEPIKEFFDIDFSFLANEPNLYERKLKAIRVIKKVIKGRCDLQPLERLQSFQSFQTFQPFQRLQTLAVHSKDYRDIEIKDNSVIYCDIPYLGTTNYGKKDSEANAFKHEEFYDWCEKQTQPTFISSYDMPEDRFTCIEIFSHRSTLSSLNNSKKVVEKVFIPKHQSYTHKNLFSSRLF